MEMSSVGKLIGVMIAIMLLLTLGVVVAMTIFAAHDATIPTHHAAAYVASGGHGHHR